MHSHPDPESFNRAVRDTAVTALTTAGHHVDVIDLYADGFDARLTAAERIVYETDKPILDPLVQRYADLVKKCEALVFVYPTWWWGMPALMKGWLERVMVMGVSFDLHPETRRVVPGLRDVRRIVGISTYGSTHASMLLFNDAGRRLVMRCVRVLCPLRTTRAKWLALYDVDRSTEHDRLAFLRRVETAMEKL